MKIILLHEKQVGFIIECDDPNIYVSGNQKGTLRIGNKLFLIEGKDRLPFIDLVGFVSCYFENEYGIIYYLGKMKVDKGNLISLPVNYDNYVNTCISIDNLEKNVKDLYNEISKVKSNLEYDSIGFLTGRKNEK